MYPEAQVGVGYDANEGQGHVKVEMVQERVERHHADQHRQENQHGQEDQHRQEEIMANRILPQKKVSSLSLVVCPIRE